MTIDTSPPPVPSRRRRTVMTSAILTVLLVVAGGTVLWRTTRTGLELTARFSAAVGVYAGSDVRILGVPVGAVDSVTPHGTMVTVAMHLDPGVAVRADTYAVVVAPNLVSDRYVQLTGAYAGGPRLQDGAVLDQARTRTPVELDTLARNLQSLTDALGPDGANRTGALSRLLRTGAANLGGNGAKLNETITRLSESGRTFDAAKGDIFATITRLSRFTGTLKAHDASLGSANDNLAAVTRTLSDDRQTFSDAVRELGSALGLVQRFVRDNRAALTGNVDRLGTVAGTLAGRRASLAKALRAAPLLLQNFLNAYDPAANLTRGRGNVNELTVWARGSASSNSAVARPVTAGNDGAPPALLPTVGAAVTQP